jgi:transcriptional regulator with XRE-family HTH domain
MTEQQEGTTGIGKRIASYRKLFGMSSSRDLAAAIPNEKITDSVIQNIESGRKSDVTVSQLLEIAHALGISPLLLLVPIGRPKNTLDLPNLSPELAAMTVDDFEDWMLVARSDLRTEGPAHITLRHVFNSMRELTQEVRSWEDQLDDAARFPSSATAEESLGGTRHRNLVRTQANIDLLVEHLSKYHVDLSWVRRPWLEATDG